MSERRTDFQGAITYTGQRLVGLVDISLKIDGVRLLFRDGKIVTRNNEVPPGLSHAATLMACKKIRDYGDCELYTGIFHDVSGPLSQHSPVPNQFDDSHVYPLQNCEPHGYDARLHFMTLWQPTQAQIHKILMFFVAKGYEGLVLRANDRWYRVKPTYTADVLITGWFEQKDIHGDPKGVLGGYITAYGNVTAFKAADRVAHWKTKEGNVGRLIEVDYKELYPNGSFRYAVTFKRFRDDKNTEAFDTGKGAAV